MRRFGYALRRLEPERAPAVHEEEVALARSFLPNNLLLEQIARTRPQAARDLALTLDNLARARLAAGDAARAVRAHAEVVRWFRASMSNGTHTTTWEQPKEAALRDLSNALTGMGRALAYQGSPEALPALDEARSLLRIAWALPDGIRARDAPPDQGRADLARVTAFEAEALAALKDRAQTEALLAEVEPLEDMLDADAREALAACRALLSAP